MKEFPRAAATHRPSPNCRPMKIFQLLGDKNVPHRGSSTRRELALRKDLAEYFESFVNGRLLTLSRP
jgi:hypothetical protein